MRARARAQAGRLEVDDDERRVLEQEVGAGRVREADSVAAPREARVLADDLLEQAAGKPDRCVAQREQPSRRLLDVDRPTPLLDELDQPVGGVQPKLHAAQGKRTYVRMQGSRLP